MACLKYFTGVMVVQIFPSDLQKITYCVNRTKFKIAIKPKHVCLSFNDSSSNLQPVFMWATCLGPKNGSRIDMPDAD